MEVHDKNRGNLARYNITAWFYDILDFPWELRYRGWRPHLVGDVRGRVLEAGVGTGRNLRHYPPEAELTALDLSPAMLRKAAGRVREARCPVHFLRGDACMMDEVPSDAYDWVVATFLCCVLPRELQPAAVGELARVLRPGGRFRLLEMVYSSDPRLLRRQRMFTPFVQKVYGARFDRHTLRHVRENRDLVVTGTRFLRHDIYLLIEGEKRQ
ncbi:MAG: class I SAM-dependent methyltransferase [Nitrospirota bacterium]|jgi:ubiquinone/menaquinone biosynthesis C-methylase UbiE